MEKFNAIKILEEEKEMKDLFSRNLGKENYMNNVYNFVEIYIRPVLEKNLSKLNIPTPKDFIEEMREQVLTEDDISDKDKEVMLNENTIGAYYIHTITEKLIVLANRIINTLGLINKKIDIKELDIDDEYVENDVNNFSYMLQDEEIGFLGKDKKIKKQIANKIIDYLTRVKTYEINLNKYIDKYIIPTLNKYNEENKIKFDLNSNDEEILLITNNIIEITKRAIFENTNMSIMLPFIKNNIDEKTINASDFLFNDNEEVKKDFSNFFCESILNNYEEIDFIKVEKFNFEEETLNILNRDDEI